MVLLQTEFGPQTDGVSRHSSTSENVRWKKTYIKMNMSGRYKEKFCCLASVSVDLFTSTLVTDTYGMIRRACLISTQAGTVVDSVVIGAVGVESTNVWYLNTFVYIWKGVQWKKEAYSSRKICFNVPRCFQCFVKTTLPVQVLLALLFKLGSVTLYPLQHVQL